MLYLQIFCLCVLAPLSFATEWNETAVDVTLPTDIPNVPIEAALKKASNTSAKENLSKDPDVLECLRDFYGPIVFLTSKKKYSCAGTLLNKDWVLTAASCVAGNQVQSVRIGVSPTRPKGRTSAKVQKTISHPKYRMVRKRPTKDIALIKLTAPVPKALAVRLPKSALPFALEVSRPKVMVQNWNTNGSCSIMDLIPNKSCKNMTDYEFVTDEMCFFDSSNQACSTFSGSPVFCGNFQCGVVSWGQDCATDDNPWVATRVDNHLKWISSTMNSYRKIASQKSGSGSVCPVKIPMLLLLIYYLSSVF